MDDIKNRIQYGTWADHIILGAGLKQQRTGQWMMNNFEPEVYIAVSGRMFDPFNKDLTREQLIEWMQDHLIFDNGHIVAVFNNDQILWEA